MSEFDGLREAANNATPGPWAAGGFDWRDPFDARTVVGDGGASTVLDTAGYWRDFENAAYVAAASPDVVLVLLDRLEAAEGAVARVRTVCAEWDAEPNLPPAAYNAIDDVLNALAGDDEAELPPRTHKTAPVSDLGPESGQGDHRDDEGRSGAQEEGK